VRIRFLSGSPPWRKAPAAADSGLKLGKVCQAGADQIIQKARASDGWTLGRARLRLMVWLPH
jgi:hypothetical protein